MFICMWVCVYLHVGVCLSACGCVFICMWVGMSICVYFCIVCMWVFVLSVFVGGCVYVSMSVCLCVYLKDSPEVSHCKCVANSSFRICVLVVEAPV